MELVKTFSLHLAISAEITVKHNIAFQDIGLLQTANDFWTVGLPYSLNYTIQTFAELHKNYQELHHAFKDMPDAQDIHQLFLELANLIQDILLLTETPHRRPRAPLEFVGSIFHGLFRTAEDADVQAFRQKLANLDENQEHHTTSRNN